ncbi:MAG TPA: galactose oxidase-like domain-containing protein [Rhizomicrobium sp.]|jgi:hypothetical protein|nr:galactose oxidase-like domain-containing protein [Rhizomicrobium sp.]
MRFVLLPVAMLALAVAAGVAISAPKTRSALSELDKTGSQTGAPVDYGYGPGQGKPKHLLKSATAGYALGSVPAGGVNAGTEGFFDMPVTWPINGLHAVLLPDGRVMNYGTNQSGAQGAAFVYDVWDPKLGTGTNAHMVLPNTTATDIFCSAQSVLWGTGEVFISGGDKTINGTRNYSINNTTVFAPQTNTIRAATAMTYPRWYPSIVALPKGDMLVLGGRMNMSPDVPATTPELFNPTTGWRVLTGADSPTAFSTTRNLWFYPRAFLARDGKVFIIDNAGHMWSLSTAGNGSITQVAQQTATSNELLPTVMYAPDMLLSLRYSRAVLRINMRKSTAPVVSQVAPIDQVRYWANATVMADGRVFVNGGSTDANVLPGIMPSQIWNPKTGNWSTGASAIIPRLYHSIALLLPDGTILTAAGGSPGPVTNLNAEIYYPPYLYRNDSSGDPVTRPTIESAPAVAKLGQGVTVTVGKKNTIKRVTFVRMGSVTHSFNNDQRFIEASFTQTGQTVVATLPDDPDVMLPGYYMMFVFGKRAPSVAKIMLVTTP